ncbi:hypothetical protein KUC_2926 [Vreelandella boliviensis LC1]|uniref:Uncharacterized protein n=1 Tax=Vreelandella boliviensis LC1 TaxID=1072583 RepID=A0A7U9C2P5_9GAMM|nr:hypothetical protein KUC_2926 [Halomonas boliviensis LC1]
MEWLSANTESCEQSNAHAVTPSVSYLISHSQLPLGPFC